MSRKQQSAENHTITSFEGYYNFLSNDYPSWVHYQGLAYPSISTAFQAARTDDPKIRLKISNVSDTQQFRQIAMSISNPDDWIQKRDHIMEMLVRDKFKRSKQILEKLMATKDKKLVNGMKNAGSSQLYWGVYQGQGKNVLGKILMSIREEFNKGTDTKNWIQQNLNLETDVNMFPILTMSVLKDGKKIQKLDFSKKKNYYLFGSLKTVDFHLQNPTISRNHACVYFSDLEVMLVDLKSTHGTFVKRKGEDEKIQLEGLVPCKLFKDDIVQFGTSAREYIIDIDRSSIQKYIAEQEADLTANRKSISEKLSNPDEYQKLSKQDVKSLLGMESQCLLVQSLTKTDNYQKIKEYFGKFGKVTNVRMKINQRTGRTEDKALVYFDKSTTIGEVVSKKKQIEYKISSIAQSEAEQLLNPDQIKKQQRKSRSRSKERERQKSRRQSTSRSRSRDKKKKTKHEKH